MRNDCRWFSLSASCRMETGKTFGADSHLCLSGRASSFSPDMPMITLGRKSSTWADSIYSPNHSGKKSLSSLYGLVWLDWEGEQERFWLREYAHAQRLLTKPWADRCLVVTSLIDVECRECVSARVPFR